MKTDMFDTVEEAIAAIAAGQLVVVSDDADRENEGDLIMAASKATPETVNMMIRYGSGIVCVPMLGNQLDRLQLGPMVARNREVQRTDFAVSVDASAGISTGVSAYDRNVTIKILADPSATADQLVQRPCVPAPGQAGRSAGTGRAHGGGGGPRALGGTAARRSFVRTRERRRHDAALAPAR